MEGTKPKSIFDIPKPIPTAEEVEAAKPKRRKKRSKTPKKKRPKVAKAGGVEVSQKTSVNGRKQLTLKHKGGLTQEITIYTGDQKPRGAKAKGQVANWNMKPAKFKKSRGLRDDRVYLQPPKREYFGNRYKSAIDKIKIDQKVKEAGASKNKEIADVRDTARREREQLTQRTRAKDDTISELKREKAGIVASHNVSQRNQSKATILGGDVGELNKLINRRGYNAIRTLVLKGEITDSSTILQLDLDAGQIDRLITLLTGEQSEYQVGAGLVYLTGKGIAMEGNVLSETGNFVNVRRKDGVEVRVPKKNIQSGKEVLESRERSRDPSVRAGATIPQPRTDPPRKRTESEERERPAHRRDRADITKRRDELVFVGEAQQEFTESSSDEGESSALLKKSPSPQSKLKGIASTIRETLRPVPSSQKKGKERSPEQEASLERLESIAKELTPQSRIAEGGSSSEEQFAQIESSVSEGAEGESEDLDFQPTPEPEPVVEQPLQLELESGTEVSEEDIGAPRRSASVRREEFLGTGVGGGGSVRVRKDLPKLSSTQIQSIVDDIEDGQNKYTISEITQLIKDLERRDPSDGGLPYLKSSFSTFASRKGGATPTTREFFEGLANPTPREKAEVLRKSREASQDRVAEAIQRTERAGIKPVITATDAAPVYFNAPGTQKQFQRRGGVLVPEDEESRQIREGQKFLQKFGGGVGYNQRRTDRRKVGESDMDRIVREAAEQSERRAKRFGGGSSESRSPTPSTNYYDSSELEGLLEGESGTQSSDADTLLVDNRKKRAKKSVEKSGKLTTSKPTKQYTYGTIEARIASVYKDQPATKERLTKQLKKSQKENKPFATADKKLLNALGFRD